MKRELHVRFCERLEGETPSCLLCVHSSAHSAVKKSGHTRSKQVLFILDSNSDEQK